VVAKYHGCARLPLEDIRFLGSLVDDSRSVSFDAKETTKASMFTDRGVGDAIAGRRVHTGGGNLKPPLKVGNGSLSSFGR